MDSEKTKKTGGLGETLKRIVGIQGSTKEAILPMMAYSTANIGSAASNLAANVHYSPYIHYIVGLSTTQTSMIALVRTIWDAINDPMIGVWVDRTRSSLGRHRIHMLWSAVPFALSYVLRWDPLGLVREGSVSSKIVYYMIVGLLIATFESVFNIAHSSMLPAIVPGYFERAQYNSMTYIFNAIGMVPTQLISAAIVGIRSTQEYTYGIFPKLLKLILVMGLLLTVTILVTGAATKEPSSKRDVLPSFDLRQFLLELKDVFRNKAFRQYFFTNFLHLFGSSFSGASAMHFLRYVAQRWDLRSQLQIASGFEAATFPINYALTKKYGKQKCAQLTTPLLYVSIGLGLLIRPPKGRGIPWSTIFLFAREIFSVVGYSGYSFTLTNIFPDITDVDEMIVGRRREATIATFRSFITKMTGGFMNSVVGVILEWFGVTDETSEKPAFKARAVDINPALNRTFGLKMASSVVPLVFLHFALRQLRSYKMTQEDHTLVRRVLKERKENGFAEVTDGEKALLENIAGQRWEAMWVGTRQEAAAGAN
ncbi:MAG: MFS transporter [Oscillospiraceae bacterium]|jgi:GPH family glycoside/pentoside/hexuronide:cation symporter|nr:MFS transporter [Oscillospiraceae bacterium]